MALISIKDDLFLGWISEEYIKDVKEGWEGTIGFIETFQWEKGGGECSRGTIEI
jgi:hypothetical protein